MEGFETTPIPLDLFDTLSSPACTADGPTPTECAAANAMLFDILGCDIDCREETGSFTTCGNAFDCEATVLPPCTEGTGGLLSPAPIGGGDSSAADDAAAAATGGVDMAAMAGMDMMDMMAGMGTGTGAAGALSFLKKRLKIAVLLCATVEFFVAFW